MRKSKAIRILAALLAVVLTLGVLPVQSPAANAQETADSYVENWSLTLSDDISANFKMHIGEQTKADANAKVQVQVGDKVTDYLISKLGNAPVKALLAATQMTDTITVRVVLSDSSVIFEKDYTLRGYADYILASGASQEAKDLVQNMLEYGAAAQLLFDHNTGNLANDGLNTTLAEPANDGKDVEMTGAVEGVSFYGASLLVHDKIAIRYYFNADDVTGLTFTCGDQSLDPVAKEEGLYYVDVEGISPNQYSEDRTVTVSDGVDSCVVTYSVERYIKRMYYKESSSDATKALVKSLWNYNAAAIAYVNAGGSTYEPPVAEDLLSLATCPIAELQTEVTNGSNSAWKLNLEGDSWSYFDFTLPEAVDVSNHKIVMDVMFVDYTARFHVAGLNDQWIDTAGTWCKANEWVTVEYNLFDNNQGITECSLIKLGVENGTGKPQAIYVDNVRLEDVDIKRGKAFTPEFTTSFDAADYAKVSFDYLITEGETIFLAVMEGWNLFYGYITFNADGETTDYAGVTTTKLDDGYVHVDMVLDEIKVLNGNDPNKRTAPETVSMLYMRGNGYSDASGFIDNIVCKLDQTPTEPEETEPEESEPTGEVVNRGTALTAKTDYSLSLPQKDYERIYFDYRIGEGESFPIMFGNWSKWYGYYYFDSNGAQNDYAGVSTRKMSDGYIRVTLTLSELGITNNVGNTDNAPDSVTLVYLWGMYSTANGFIDNVRGEVATVGKPLEAYEYAKRTILYGKSVLFIGDSITAAGAPHDTEHPGYGWAGRIGTWNEMQWKNAGVGGATISNSRTPNTLMTQLENSDGDYELVVLHGGINDATDKVALGTITAEGTTEFDVSTFAGAMENIIYQTMQKYPNATLGFILNYSTPNSYYGGYTQDFADYIEVMRQVCDKWDVPYLDLYAGKIEAYDEMVSYSKDILKTDTGTYFSYGSTGEIHLSSLGYDVITPYIEKWLIDVASYCDREGDLLIDATIASTNGLTAEVQSEHTYQSATALKITGTTTTWPSVAIDFGSSQDWTDVIALYADGMFVDADSTEFYCHLRNSNNQKIGNNFNFRYYTSEWSTGTISASVFGLSAEQKKDVRYLYVGINNESATGFVAYMDNLLVKTELPGATPYAEEDRTALYGKSVLFVGDSITHAIGDYTASELGWPGRIGISNEMDWVNGGNSGATVSNNRHNVVSQIKKYGSRDFDYVVLHGGFNDAMDSVALGTVTPEGTTTFDLSTLAGGAEDLIYQTKQLYPNAKIGYILNYATPNSGFGGATRDFANYIDTLKQVCDKWDVPYLDLYSGTTQVDGRTVSYSEDLLQTYLPDNMVYESVSEIHLNYKGYDIIAPFIEKWMLEELCGVEVVEKPRGEVLTAGQDFTKGKPSPSGVYNQISFDYKINEGKQFGLIVGNWSSYYGYYLFDSNGTKQAYDGVTTEKLSDGYICATLTMSELTLCSSSTPPEGLDLFYIWKGNSNADGYIDRVTYSYIESGESEEPTEPEETEPVVADEDDFLNNATIEGVNQNKITNGSNSAWKIVRGTGWSYPAFSFDEAIDISNYTLQMDIYPTGADYFRVHLATVNGDWGASSGGASYHTMDEWSTLSYDLGSICADKYTEMTAFTLGMEFGGTVSGEVALYIDNVRLIPNE